MKKEQLENKEDLGKSNKIQNKNSIEKLETNRKKTFRNTKKRKYRSWIYYRATGNIVLLKCSDHATNIDSTVLTPVKMEEVNPSSPQAKSSIMDFQPWLHVSSGAASDRLFPFSFAYSVSWHFYLFTF